MDLVVLSAALDDDAVGACAAGRCQLEQSWAHAGVEALFNEAKFERTLASDGTAPDPVMQLNLVSDELQESRGARPVLTLKALLPVRPPASAVLVFSQVGPGDFTRTPPLELFRSECQREPPSSAEQMRSCLELWGQVLTHLCHHRLCGLRQ